MDTNNITSQVNNGDIADKKIDKERINNYYGLTGFILGLLSIFLGVGLLPILAIIFSSIGLAKFNPKVNKRKWQAVVGLILGIIYTLIYMVNYGYI